MSFGKRINRLWLFGLVALAGLIGAGYLILSNGTQAAITRGLFNREAIIARADAANIKSFFEAVGNSVALRAQLRSMHRSDTTTSDDLDAFVEQWRDSGLVAGIILTNSQGVVILNSNVRNTPDVGESLADRDYFAWAKNQKKEGEYYVGQPVVSPLGASKGQVIVPVASPVFANGVFQGAVSAAVKLQPLVQRDLELMKVSDRTNVYLIGQDGGLLYSSPGSRVLGDDVKKMLNITKLSQVQKDGLLITYSPVTLKGQNWLLIVTLPIQEVSDSAIPMNIRQAAVLISVSLIVLVFGYASVGKFRTKR